jgi:hypothetical protein
MSAAGALMDARAAGIHLKAEGDELVWGSSWPPSPQLLEKLAEYKQEIILLIHREKRPWSPAEWRAFHALRYKALIQDGLTPEEALALAFEARAVECLNQTPAPSEPGCCAECGQSDQAGWPLVPHGIHPKEYTWLHSQCWPAWSKGRREAAYVALAGMGLNA